MGKVLYIGSTPTMTERRRARVGRVLLVVVAAVLTLVMAGSIVAWAVW